MKQKITIIHFLPLELYPPIINLLDYLSTAKPKFNIIVFTTKSNTTLTPYSNDNIQICRYPPIHPKASNFSKVSRYARFYLSSFLKILSFKPSTILYFETLSALPALWYKKFKKNVNIFAHYHEIVTLKELESERPLNKFINTIEKKHYRQYKWISQTNNMRLSIFAKQYGISENASNLQTLPNYPPQSWVTKPKIVQDKSKIIKLLYIGSLSLEGMYLQEVLDQFGSNPKFSIDFYSHQFTKKVKNAILKHKNCQIKGAINYQEIPNLKGKYDIGLVMYKDHSINVKYCAPNKLFEYLALDLDVWCSDKLITAENYERLNCYPKVLMLDYENLASFDVEKAISKRNLKYVPSPYIAEDVYENLVNAINGN